MKTKLIPFLAACLLTTLPTFAATDDLAAALQKGLFEEEANNNLNAAIQAYQSIATQSEKDRKMAATAIFRLGECYRKLGNTNDATAQYQRIVRDFPDQQTLVSLSRQNLAALASPPNVPAGLPLSTAARLEQRRLLADEIKLVEQKLAAQQQRIAVGRDTPDSLLSIQRDLLDLQRQLAAFDAGQLLAASATTASTPPTSAEAEEVKRIQALIKDSPDLINAKDSQGLTPLHHAAGAGQLVVAGFLLANGAEVDARTGHQPNTANDAEGRTPLHFAAQAGHKAMVELLLSRNAKIGAADNEGRTPLHLAVEKGFRSVVEVLLAHGADVNAKTRSAVTPLHLAAANGFTSVAEVLLAHGAEVNSPDAHLYSGGADRYGTPLHFAVGLRDQAFTEWLLTHRADANAVNQNGRTPLSLAASGGDVGIASSLLSHGADVDATNDKPQSLGWSPLHYAVGNNQKEMAALLLNHKADPNARIESPGEFGQGFTPLLMAISRQQADIVELLLDHKADPNLKSEAGLTSLLSAMASAPPTPAQRRIVAALLAHGAQTEVRTSPDSRTPLMVAIDMPDLELLQLLLAHKANVNAVDIGGWTALHHAAYRSASSGGLKMAELLLANGADANAMSNDGGTPLNLALVGISNNSGPVKAAYQQMADLLRQHGALDDVPRMDRIGVRRAATGFSAFPLLKGANDWNHFTLLEVLAVQFQLLSALPQGEMGSRLSLSDLGAANKSLFLPDWARLSVRRPGSDGKTWQEQLVNLSTSLRSTNCTDMPLEWGDVVEVPEEDHPLGVSAAEFPTSVLDYLQRCLSRHIQVLVNSRTNDLVLAPRIEHSYDPSTSPRQYVGVFTKAPFWIRPALLKSGLLMTSSDLSRVKVTRRDPATGRKLEWVLDCRESQPAPDLWLRDGDLIEVPEKP